MPLYPSHHYPSYPIMAAAREDIPQHNLGSAGQVDVRNVVEAIYSGALTPAEGSKKCESSAANLERWARDLPPGLYNNSSTSSLRRATNRMFSIKDSRETEWQEDEMRVILRDVIWGGKSIRSQSTRTSIRKFGLKGESSNLNLPHSTSHLTSFYDHS